MGGFVVEEGFGDWHPPLNPMMLKLALEEESFVRKSRRDGARIFFLAMFLLVVGAIVSSLLERTFHFKLQDWEIACYVVPIALVGTFGVFGMFEENSITKVPSWVVLKD